MAAEQPEVDMLGEAAGLDGAALIDEDFSLEQEIAEVEQNSNQQYQGNIDLILDVGLDVVVELGKVKMKIREILQLAPGSVIGLDRLAGEPVDVLVNDYPIAKGEVVLLDETLGIRITNIITPIQRIQSLK